MNWNFKYLKALTTQMPESTKRKIELVVFIMTKKTFAVLQQSVVQSDQQAIHSRQPQVCIAIKLAMKEDLSKPQVINRLQSQVQSACPILRSHFTRLSCLTPYNKSKFILTFKSRCRNQEKCRSAFLTRLGAEIEVNVGKIGVVEKVRAVNFIREGGLQHFQQEVGAIGFKNLIIKTTEAGQPSAAYHYKTLYNIIKPQLEKQADNTDQVVDHKKLQNFLRTESTKMEFLQQIMNQIDRTEEVRDTGDMRKFLLQRLEELAAPLSDPSATLPRQLLFECFAANFYTLIGFNSHEFSGHKWNEKPKQFLFHQIRENQNYNDLGFSKLGRVNTFDEQQYEDFLIFEYPVVTSLIKLLPKIFLNKLVDHNIEFWLLKNPPKSLETVSEAKDQSADELELRQAKAMSTYDFVGSNNQVHKYLEGAIRELVRRRRPVENSEILATQLFEDAQMEVKDAEANLQALIEERQRLNHDIELATENLKSKKRASSKLFENMWNAKMFSKIAKIADQAKKEIPTDQQDFFQAECQANTRELSDQEVSELRKLKVTTDQKTSIQLEKEAIKAELKSQNATTARNDARNITLQPTSNISTQAQSPQHTQHVPIKKGKQLIEKIENEALKKQIEQKQRLVGASMPQSITGSQVV